MIILKKMPNHVKNYLVVETSPLIIEEIRFSIKQNNLFDTFFPVPKTILGNDEKVIKWCYENWGTKWDIYDSEEISKIPGIITLKFNTAYDPPIGFYNEFQKQVYSIKAYYFEDWSGKYGKYEYTKYTEANELPKDILDIFNKE